LIKKIITGFGSKEIGVNNLAGILGDGGADPDGLVGGEGWGVERGVT